MLGERIQDEIFTKNYPTRTTNEYNYWWRKNTEKGREYRKRINQNHYIRNSKSPVSTRAILEKKKSLANDV